MLILMCEFIYNMKINSLQIEQSLKCNKLWTFNNHILINIESDHMIFSKVWNIRLILTLNRMWTFAGKTSSADEDCPNRESSSITEKNTPTIMSRFTMRNTTEGN